MYFSSTFRPLPDELVQYARSDTHYLIYVYERMRNDLLQKANGKNNLLLSVIDRSREVALRVRCSIPCTSNSLVVILFMT